MRVALEATPSVSNLFLDFLHGTERARRFYPSAHSLDSIEQFARRHAVVGDPERERLASVLQAQQERWGLDTAAVDKLRGGAVAVVTGQQAGLLTGPMYSILKALTAVKVARELDQRGVDAVPVFWIASEDHDHEEIEWAGILTRDSTLERIRTSLADGVGTPVGWLQFPPEIRSVIEECFHLLPTSEFQPEIRSLVETAYYPGASPVDAFAKMLGQLSKGLGLLIADPLDPDFRALSVNILSRVAENEELIRSAVLERSRLLAEAGYPGQVRVDEDFTGLFAYQGRSRKALKPGDERSGLELSPNVLLRPFVQDSIFPTAAYVGGPAEVAYLGQAGSIYECLGKPMPPVFPRITATLVEPAAARVMRKHGLTVEDVFQGLDRLRTRIMGAGAAGQKFEDVRGRISEEIERLRPVLEEVDPTLGGAMDNSAQKIMHQIEGLHARFVKGAARRDEVLDRQLSSLETRLFPERKLQERIVNVTSFLIRYGPNLVQLMDKRLDLDGSVHQVFEL